MLAVLALVAGIALLIWSADRFVEGAAATARHLQVPPLLIGMVIIGFGTSVPEMMVSALSALQGNPGIALGNAYGSNITNIALIIGLTAIIRPITVHPQVHRKELPLLLGITALTFFLLSDNALSRLDAWILLGVFALLMAWTIAQGMRQHANLRGNMQEEQEIPAILLPKALFWLVAGLVLLMVSSRLLVWGAVNIAHALGVNDLLIGLTVVAVGTSLPELASSLASARKGEHDLALGNIVGSNMFNTLAVVGIAGSIHPLAVEPEVLHRDLPIMGMLTLALYAFSFGRLARINRIEGALLLLCYISYTGLLIWDMLH